MNIKEKTQGFSLQNKTALIVGCGGLGTNIAVHLAGAGMKKIYLCDFDTVNESNLNRQFLFTSDDIGRKKCEALKERLSAYSPDTEFEVLDKRIVKAEDLKTVADCDIVICGVDNAEGRKAIESFADCNNIPAVFGGIDGFYGTAYLYIPDKSPCLECAGAAYDKKAELNISSTAGIIGAIQANLAIKYLLTEDIGLSGKIFLFDGDLLETLPIVPQKNCKKCNAIEVIR